MLWRTPLYAPFTRLARRPLLQPQEGVTVTGRSPQRAAAASTGPPPPPRENVVKEEVAFANAIAEFLNQKVSFTYDERIDQIVVTVTRGESEEVIRQFPSEEMIKLTVTFRRDFRGLIFNHTV